MFCEEGKFKQKIRHQLNENKNIGSLKTINSWLNVIIMDRLIAQRIKQLIQHPSKNKIQRGLRQKKSFCKPFSVTITTFA